MRVAADHGLVSHPVGGGPGGLRGVPPVGHHVAGTGVLLLQEAVPVGQIGVQVHGPRQVAGVDADVGAAEAHVAVGAGGQGQLGPVGAGVHVDAGADLVEGGNGGDDGVVIVDGHGALFLVVGFG